MFFQVPGTMHKKVKEIMVFYFFFLKFALNFSAIENYSLGGEKKGGD